MVMVKQRRGTVNFVELIGWVGDEPEQRLLPSGTMMCTFRVATKRLGPRDAAGVRTYETDWIGVEAWDRLAALCLRLMHKGSRVRVVGSLHTQSWEDRDSGQRRYKTAVRAEEVLFLDNKGASNGSMMHDLEDAEECDETEEVSF
jgi:single-strand DNA-binding protein